MILLSVALGLFATVLALPTVSDLVSLLRILVRRPLRRPASSAAPRLLFLVPAHDEELLLAPCLESIARLRYPRERMEIVVIADNCTDRTADIARAAGVRCLVRTAPHAAGKPRAIAWALSILAIGGYDAVVIVDADTEVDRDFAARLAEAGPLAHKACQPYNGVLNRSQNALSRMAAILAEAHHGFAYALKTRARLNVPLSAGMCIGSEVLGKHGWNAYSLCEDWEMYALLTEGSVRIESVPHARLYAQEAPTLQASTSQRRRWTAGKLTVLFQHAGPLIRAEGVGLAQKLDSIAELSAPGPVLHLCLASMGGAAALLLEPPAFAWLAAVLGATLLRPVAYALAALARDPEPSRAVRAFAFLPLYAVWRIGAAVTALGMLGDKPWIRTARPIRSALRHKS